MNITGNDNASFKWTLIDAFGHVRNAGIVHDGEDHHQVTIDVNMLSTGVYTIITDRFGQMGRFLRM